MTDHSADELAKIERAIAYLQATLEALGDDPDLQAKLASLQEQRQTLLAQDSSLSGGDRAVLGSQAGENIITGEGNTVLTIINHYRPEANEADLRRQIAAYLNWMRDHYGTIPLRGIKREGEQVVQLKLEQVYVPLQARSYRQSGDRSIQLDRVLSLGRQIVITGGPGSGKTTVLLHMAWTLTEAIGTDHPDLARERLGLSFPKTKEETEEEYLTVPLPIFIPLSAYAYYRRNLPAGVEAERKTLAAFISRYLIENQHSFNLPADFFTLLLEKGRGVILLLDGLDEVPNEQERAEVRQAIEQLVKGRDDLRAVVTCRTAAYRDRTALDPRFREVKVLPLKPVHIERLVRQAYTDIHADPITANRQAADLLQAINRLEEGRRQRFGEETDRLITSPLLVRMLLIVHYSERRLPDQRAELYMKATDMMLLPEYNPDVAQANRIGGLVGGSREVHRELAAHLAFAMHQRGKTQGREIDEDELCRILADHPTYGHLAADLIALTRQRGTLLEEQLGMYRFIHLAFQEYLVAYHLAETVRSDSGLAGIAAFFEAGPILDSWWREPALLVAGYLSVMIPTQAQKYLRRLAGADEQAGQREPLAGDIQLAAAGEAFPITLYWQAMADKPPEAHFIQFNHLLDASGNLYGGYDRIPLEYYSVLLWAADEVIVDGYAVPVEADAPPGDYYLNVGYYLPMGESYINLPLVVDNQPTDIYSVVIGPIKVIE